MQIRLFSSKFVAQNPENTIISKHKVFETSLRKRIMQFSQTRQRKTSLKVQNVKLRASQINEN